ncbi:MULTISPECIES: hypothetical protein [unclassified Rathayibacter]|uniref:hypothetical protein n=1 Tax=unclassified Rathayibacter TaxID=2609250 RepID=UPI0006F523C6|nr:MULTISPECIES: hypothetical protein [unclassified Rathayibacter]KQQ03636.1 hypothetical protein ASF42_09075 [Rathayibacter sp. Leaf294]KQS12092.1 hypothetical protein ASG06_09075 [Rathayibacter sp. Leaf185]
MRPYDTRALASAVIGVAAVLSMSVPAVGAVLAVVAIVLGLGARRRLRADETLRGSRASFAGVVLGLGALAVGVVPQLLGSLLTLLA